jgi:hypothetical protein
MTIRNPMLWALVVLLGTALVGLWLGIAWLLAYSN